jgi:hypothetical protein
LDVVRDTDDAGDFEAQLEPGFYDVCAMAIGMTAQCKKILVIDGKPVKQDFALKVDPLVLKYTH